MALIEVVSPANKDRDKGVRDFVNKLYDAIASGIHVLLVDLFPPGPSDPQGMHAALWQEISPTAKAESLDRPLCLASYEAEECPEAFLEPISVGDVLPDMPLFYDNGLYVHVPLEKTYEQAWRGVPAFWKDVVEGRQNFRE